MVATETVTVLGQHDASGMLVIIGPRIGVNRAIEGRQMSYRAVVECSVSPDFLVWVGAVGPVSELLGHCERGNWLIAKYGYFYSRLEHNGGEADWLRVDIGSIAADLDESGEHCLQNLDGSFMLVAVNKKTGVTYLRSDSGGVRRLFSAEQTELQVFSNKIYAVADIVGRDENVVARDFYFVYGYSPLKHTVYEKVVKIDGGRIVRVTNGLMDVLPKADSASFQLERPESFESAIDRLYEGLTGCLAAQTEGAKRVAVLLGGFDSALVAAMAKKAGFEVETFSFYYEDEAFNQTHTDTLAAFLGIRHNWVKVDHEVIGRGLASYGRIFDAPTNWANYPIQTAHLCGVIEAAGFDAILTGDGCDGLFYGYPGVYKSHRLFERLLKLPSWLSRAAARAVSYSGLESLGGHPARVLLRILRTASHVQPARSYFMYRFMDETSVSRLTGKRLCDVEKRVDDLTAAALKTVPSVTPTALAYLGKNAAAPSKTKLAGSSDLCGLPLYSPFMHPEVVRLTRTFPDEWLRPETNDRAMAEIGKYILVRMTQKYGLLPDEVVLQRKISAVNAPADNWYKHSLRKEIKTILSRLPFEYREQYVDNLLGFKLLERLYVNHVSSDALTSHALMLCVTYAAYFEVTRETHH